MSIDRTPCIDCGQPRRWSFVEFCPKCARKRGWHVRRQAPRWVYSASGSLVGFAGTTAAIYAITGIFGEAQIWFLP